MAGYRSHKAQSSINWRDAEDMDIPFESKMSEVLICVALKQMV